MSSDQAFGYGNKITDEEKLPESEENKDSNTRANFKRESDLVNNTKPDVVIKDIFDETEKDAIFLSSDKTLFEGKSLGENSQMDMTVNQLESASMEKDSISPSKIICDYKVPVVSLTDVFDRVDKDSILTSLDSALSNGKSLEQKNSDMRMTPSSINSDNNVPVVILSDVLENNANVEVENFDNMLVEEPQHEHMDVEELMSEQCGNSDVHSTVLPVNNKFPVVVLTDFCGNVSTKSSPHPTLRSSIRPAEPRLADVARKNTSFSDLPPEFCQDTYPTLPASLLSSKSIEKDVMMPDTAYSKNENSHSDPDIADSEDEDLESKEEPKNPPADQK